MTTVTWRSRPAAHDSPAAGSYLFLLVADPALRAGLIDLPAEVPVVTPEPARFATRSLPVKRTPRKA